MFLLVYGRYGIQVVFTRCPAAHSAICRSLGHRISQNEFQTYIYFMYFLMIEIRGSKLDSPVPIQIRSNPLYRDLLLDYLR